MLDAVCRVKLCLSDAPLKQQTPFLPLRGALLCCLYSRFSQATSVPYGHPYRLWFTPSLRPLFLLCFPANPCRRCFLAFFRGSPLENSHLHTPFTPRNWCRMLRRWWRPKPPGHCRRTEQEQLREAARWMRRRACSHRRSSPRS